MPSVSMSVNGKSVSGEVEARTLLVEFLREHLRLTGTHVGCDTSQCGACVVHVDGDSVKSCTMLALQAEGSDVKTIEGVANGDELHPMQEAFRGKPRPSVRILHTRNGAECARTREAQSGSIRTRSPRMA